MSSPPATTLEYEAGGLLAAAVGFPVIDPVPAVMFKPVGNLVAEYVRV